MNIRQIYEYYSREDVQEFLINFGRNREVVGVFKTGSYSQRPNILVYPNDIVAMVKTGVIEFHSSLERWSQPMNIKLENYEKFRVGWDLILDVDCENIEHGKIASNIFVWALREHGIKNISVKFTGGTGFHIGIPWESMPAEVDYKPTVTQYPDIARKIVMYLKYFSKGKLEKALLSKFDVEELAEQSGKAMGEILTDEGIDPYKVVDIDPVLISPRHLFRMPYSLNRKTFLVSLPIKTRDIPEFNARLASPEKVKITTGFLDKYEPDEASVLITQAVDWFMRINKKIKKKKTVSAITKVVPIENFPPCIKNILKGLSDGRKRSVFILINFLRSCKWKWENIEKLIGEWNERNKPPLRESYIRGQIRWHKSRGKDILPPNCHHSGWYDDFGVCKPDEKCKKIKNPVNYVFKKYRKRSK
ncbi:MAG: hypothetical protein J7K72_05150 [Candidatus Aenigmarchaeota archaeon]|nr:hypothetical protein [Candidatus Aenigmarchaeota archaeon]